MSLRLSSSVSHGHNEVVRRELWATAHVKWQLNVLITIAGTVALLISQQALTRWVRFVLLEHKGCLSGWPQGIFHSQSNCESQSWKSNGILFKPALTLWILYFTLNLTTPQALHKKSKLYSPWSFLYPNWWCRYRKFEELSSSLVASAFTKARSWETAHHSTHPASPPTQGLKSVRRSIMFLKIKTTFHPNPVASCSKNYFIVCVLGFPVKSNLVA